MIAMLLKFVRFFSEKEDIFEKAKSAFRTNKELTIHDLSVLLNINEFISWDIISKLEKKDVIELAGSKTIIPRTGEHISNLALYKLVQS